jgi:hypothetical protein
MVPDSNYKIENITDQGISFRLQVQSKPSLHDEKQQTTLCARAYCPAETVHDD